MDTMDMDMARGLLMLRPAMDMAMDTDMEVMAMGMVMVMDMARGPLMLRPAMDMAMDTDMEVMAMEAMEAMDMDMAMDTAMDTVTMDKRNKPEMFHRVQYQELSEHFMKFIYIKSSHDLPCCY